MEETLMQGGEPSGADQMKQEIMAIADQIMQEWQKTGEIDGQKVKDEKQAKKMAITLAMQQLEQQAQEAQMAQQAPQQAPPQAAPQPPMGGGMMG